MCWTKAQIYISPRALVVPTSRVWYSLPSQPCLCLCVCVSLPSSYVCCILCPTLETQHMAALTHADRNALLYSGWFHACRASCPMGKGRKKKPFVFNICSNYINPWISLEPSGWIASLIQTLEKTCVEQVDPLSVTAAEEATCKSKLWN